MQNAGRTYNIAKYEKKLAKKTYTFLQLVIILSAGIVIAELIKTARLWCYVSALCLIAPSCVPIPPVLVAVHTTAIKL